MPWDENPFGIPSWGDTFANVPAPSSGATLASGQDWPGTWSPSPNEDRPGSQIQTGDSISGPPVEQQQPQTTQPWQIGMATGQPKPVTPQDVQSWISPGWNFNYAPTSENVAKEQANWWNKINQQQPTLADQSTMQQMQQNWAQGWAQRAQQAQQLGVTGLTGREGQWGYQQALNTQTQSQQNMANAEAAYHLRPGTLMDWFNYGVQSNTLGGDYYPKGQQTTPAPVDYGIMANLPPATAFNNVPSSPTAGYSTQPSTTPGAFATPPQVSFPFPVPGAPTPKTLPKLGFPVKPKTQEPRYGYGRRGGYARGGGGGGGGGYGNNKGNWFFNLVNWNIPPNSRG